MTTKFLPAALLSIGLLALTATRPEKIQDTTVSNPVAVVEAQQGTISISGAFALYPLTVKWAEEFKKTHPGIKIDISAGGAGKGITDVLSNVTDIGLVSRDLTK